MGDNTEATAYDSIGVIADGETLIVSAAGAADISGTGTVGLGASVNTLIMDNTVAAAVGENSQLIAYALAKGADAGVKTSINAALALTRRRWLRVFCWLVFVVSLTL